MSLCAQFFFYQLLILLRIYAKITKIPRKEKDLTMKLSVIIPMYNEEKIVEEAVAALDQQLLADFGAGEYEMIFVSDGSRDSCQEKAEAMMASTLEVYSPPSVG